MTKAKTAEEVAGSKKLRVLDLFSGIGGFSLGLERTGGFETTGFCEIDRYASEVLRKWFPEVPNETRGIVALSALLRRARISSAPAFRAKISRLQAKAPDLPDPVRDSSGHYFEPLAWFDREARCWRTWQRCLAASAYSILSIDRRCVSRLRGQRL